MSTERVPINVLLRSEQSGEQIAVMDNTVSAGFPGPPLHHHAFDETFYVLEGELTFQLEDEFFTRKAGELAFAPRNVPHTFANLSGADARTLIICTPAGFERYFARMAAKRQGKVPPEWALQPIPEVTTVGPASTSARADEARFRRSRAAPWTDSRGSSPRGPYRPRPGATAERGVPGTRPR